jgi:hypothetical protein
VKTNRGAWDERRGAIASNLILVVSPFAILLLLFGPSAASAQPLWSGIIDPSRAIDWSHAGIPGGIPSANWPIYTTLSPSGGADDSVAIQTAIDNAPVGSVVVLNPGTYTLHRASKVCVGRGDDGAYGVYESGLCLDKSVVLRGAGPGKTILNYGDGANIISLGRTFLSHTNANMVSITAGPTKGSTQITVSNVSGVTRGCYIVITQTNPLDSDGNLLVDTTGYGGFCSYCGHDMPNTVMTQIDKVTDVSGTTLTLERPLYFNFTNAPQYYLLPNMVESIGLEELQVVGTASSGTGLVYKNINLESCAHCWVHNMESDNTVDRANIYLSDVYSSEISNNYLNNDTGAWPINHNSGADYSLLLEFRNSENLLQNNIIRKARHSIPQSGSSGNVYAYNYMLDAYMGEYPNSLPETQAHSAHPFMNLWEGNVMPNVEFDFTHGSSSHGTMFRNDVDLLSTNPDTGQPMTGGIIALNVAYYSNYYNIIGNAFGPYGSACTAGTYETDADTPKVNGVVYQLGYYDDGGGSSPNLTLSAKVGQTILRGGNWDCVTQAAIWNNNVPNGSLVASYLPPQTLPSSLFLPAKPAWFGSATWPPIDPAASTIVNQIPAQLCYQNTAAQGLPFNPDTCYGSSAPQPQPPPITTGGPIFSPRAYPNPWRSDRGYAQQITFDQLAGNTTIKIFTVSGHLIKTLGAQGSGLGTASAIWDLTNDSGDRVASGIYIYVATNDQGQQAQGKVAVIR